MEDFKRTGNIKMEMLCGIIETSIEETRTYSRVSFMNEFSLGSHWKIQMIMSISCSLNQYYLMQKPYEIYSSNQ